MSSKQQQVNTPWGVGFIDVYVCDGCETETTEDDALGWITIDRFGMSVEQMGDRPTPLHACSPYCAEVALSRLSWVRADPIGGAR